MVAEMSSPVDLILAECAEALRAGRRGDCLALQAKHPELSDEIAAFMRDFERVETRFAPLRELTSPGRTAAEIATLGRDDTAVPAPPKPGGTFGDYDLLSEVARGGMGVVYKARQRSLNRVVALKMVLGGGRDTSLDRNRFLVEARAVARLNHAHIVPIYEVGEQGGQPYFTMEFFSGGSLRDKLDSLRGDQRAIAKLMATTSRAVEHAHRRGILHRDLKPTNVLIDERGEPHVTDFGLAKQIGEESDLTQAGAIVGTPSYMAPEQAQASTDLSTAVDVYGLGAMLYELLTGRPPFKGNTPLETMMAAMLQEPQRPRRLSAGVDADLETICLKCLAKLPTDRYGSAEALADDLDRWLRGEPIHARRASAAERLFKWSKRQPLLAGALATVAAVIVGLLTLAGLYWQNAEQRAQLVQNLGEAKTQLAQVDQDRQRAEAKKSEAEKLTDKIKAEVDQLQNEATAARKELSDARTEARRTLYAADIQLAHVAWQAGNVGSTNELLQKYLPAEANARIDDPRGFEWHYLWRQAHAARRSWRPETPTSAGMSPLSGIAFSPDGKTVATAGGSDSAKHLRLWNVEDGKLIRTIPLGDANVVQLAFTDEGRRVMVTHRKQINWGLMDKWITDLGAKKEPFSPSQLQQSLEYRSWSVSADGPAKVEPFDPARLESTAFTALAGVPFLVHEGKAFAPMSLTRSPDGKLLAMSGMNVALPSEKVPPEQMIRGGSVLVYDLEKREVVARRDDAKTGLSISFARDSKRLAVGYSSGVIEIFSADLAKSERHIVGHSGSALTTEFMPDGRTLLSGGRDGQLRKWNIETGELTASFRGHNAAVKLIAVAPDGGLILTSGLDGEVKLWNSTGTSETTVLRGHKMPVTGLAFSADGRELYSVDWKAQYKTWQTEDGQLLRETAGSKPAMMGAKISRSGRLMLWVDDRALIVRDVVAGKERRLTWKDRNFNIYALSPDERWLASGDSTHGEISVWRLEDASLVKTLKFDAEVRHAQGLEFAPDNRTLAAFHRLDAKGGSYASSLVLWDCETGERRSIFEAKASTGTPAFSPDQSRIAFSEIGNAVRIWNLAENRLEHELRGAGLIVHALSFSPDGRRLMTAGMTPSEQGLVKLWDVANGREVFSAPLPQAKITTAAFSLDGRRLAAALTTNDGFSPQMQADIQIWDASPTVEESRPAAAPANNEVSPVEGAWIVTAAELNGMKVVSSEGDRFTFRADRVTIQTKVKTTDPTTFRIDAAATPKTIDLDDKPPMKGIFELQGDELRLCYGEKRPAEFDSKQGLLLKLKRAKP